MFKFHFFQFHKFKIEGILHPLFLELEKINYRKLKTIDKIMSLLHRIIIANRIDLNKHRGYDRLRRIGKDTYEFCFVFCHFIFWS